MLRSWNQPQVSRPFSRISGSLDSWLRRFSSVVQLIICLNIAVFVVQLICILASFSYFEQMFALSGPGLTKGFIWQPFTYMFLHGGIFHILFNMLFLWFFGREVEYYIGAKYFTRLYIAAGLAGAALWMVFNFSSRVPVIGASAAVLGCVIAFATLFPEREITLLVFFVLPVRLKAKYLAFITVAIDAVMFLTQPNSHVAHLAHLGGAALGYIYIKHLGYGTTPRWIFWGQDIGKRLKPRHAPKKRDLRPEEFMSKYVNPILDKIAREGIHSLTSEERKILESAKELLNKNRR